MELPEPRQQLVQGIELLCGPLAPHGFTFALRGEGRGSGGPFAWGEFVRADRRLVLHYRNSLGEVTYHAGSVVVGHVSYMRSLGVLENCRYPGFSREPLQVFRDLAHDLRFADDFLHGDASILVTASTQEKVKSDSESERVMADYSGQTKVLAKMREDFIAGKYRAVVAAYEELPLPHLLTDAQIKLVQLARAKDA
jgi:hypothetical protein